MTRLIDLTDKRYGRLVVMRRDGRITPARWICRCDCGKECSIQGGNLTSSNARSCGCLRRESLSGTGKSNAKPFGVAARNGIKEVYTRNARNRNIVWDLSDEEFDSLITSSCVYCGEIPSRVFKKSENTGFFIYGGIDRVNSALGYTEGNAVPCCWQCNRMKSAMGVRDFLSHIQKIYRHNNEE